MDIIIIVLIVWFVISRNKKNKQKNAQRQTVLNGQRIDTAVGKMNSYQKNSTYYKQPVQNQANGRAVPQNNGYGSRPMQNQEKQQELKRRLQQKYANSGKTYPQGNTYQKPMQEENDILSRAKSNVQENAIDNLKNQALQESGGGVYTASGVMKNAQKKPEEQLVSSGMGNEYLGMVDINQDSDVLKQVNDLMVTGYSGEMSFERDFVAEGVEMLNRYEL